jgi:hypothetical protein
MVACYSIISFGLRRHDVGDDAVGILAFTVFGWVACRPAADSKNAHLRMNEFGL